MKPREFSKPSIKKAQFEAIAPEAITSDKANINFLIMQQLDRINYLIAVGIAATNENRSKTNIVTGIMQGLSSIEAMMANVLGEEYEKSVEGIKENLLHPVGVKNSLYCKLSVSGDEQKKIKAEERLDLSKHIFLCDHAPDYALNECIKWYKIIVKQLGKINLVPTKEKAFNFEE